MIIDVSGRVAATQARSYAVGKDPCVVAPIGDSRVEAIYLDGTAQRQFGASSPLNMANALIGNRLRIAQSWGKSGDRTDQMLARIDDAVASGAGTLYIQGGVNNIGAVASSGNFTYVHAVTKEVVTITTVAAVTMRDLAVMIEKGRAAGMIVVIENEVGGVGVSNNEKQAALMDLRNSIVEYSRGISRVYVHDAMPAVTNPMAMAFITGYSYDGTHVNPRGSYYWGKSLAKLLDRIVPTVYSPLIVNSAIEIPSVGRRQLLVNPTFATATGGSLGVNATGTVPASWTGLTSNAATTVAFATVADANGNGNNVTADITFGAAGHLVRLDQSLSGSSNGNYHANLLAGDVLQAVAKVEILDSSVALSSAYLYMSANNGSASFDNMCLFSNGQTTYQGINEPTVLVLKTRPFVLPASAGAYPFVVASVRAVAMAAGTSKIKIHQIGLKRL